MAEQENEREEKVEYGKTAVKETASPKATAARSPAVSSLLSTLRLFAPGVGGLRLTQGTASLDPTICGL